MKKLAYIAAAAFSLGAASAHAYEPCQQWQFLLHSDTAVSNSLLTGEINQSRTSTATFTRLHDYHSENTNASPSVSLSVDLSNADLNRVGYQINATLPVSLSDNGEQFSLSRTGPLREGYIALHQEREAKFTLYAQRTTC